MLPYDKAEEELDDLRRRATRYYYEVWNGREYEGSQNYWSVSGTDYSKSDLADIFRHAREAVTTDAERKWDVLPSLYQCMENPDFSAYLAMGYDIVPMKAPYTLNFLGGDK